MMLAVPMISRPVIMAEKSWRVLLWAAESGKKLSIKTHENLFMMRAWY